MTLLIPQFVLAELERVLIAKLDFEQEQIDAARALFAQIAAEEPARAPVVEAITGDPADDVILACAVEAGADVLATGDRKHLLPIGEHRGVRLLTPQALLAELRERG
jgi:predicted nucleic acid-binding protein